MKKMLYATTALVAVGVTAAGVGTASAAEPLKIDVKGYFNSTMGWVDQEVLTPADIVASGGNTTQNVVGFKTQKNSEIWFKGTTKLDNGITIGVDIQVEGEATNTGTADESYMWIESASLGKITIGEENVPPYLMHVGEPAMVGVGFTSGDIIFDYTDLNIGTGMSMVNTGINTQNDSRMISYITPRVMGFQAGFGYVPVDNQVDGTMIAAAGVKRHGKHFALQYKSVFDGVGVGASVGYETWNTPANTAFSQLGNSKVRSVSYGLQLNYAGFQVNGGFKRGISGIAATGVSAKGKMWGGGVKYGQGPWAVSLGYHNGEANGLIAQGGSDGLDQLQFDGSYALGPGVTAVGSFYHVKAETEFATNSNTGVERDNSAMGVVGGIKVAF